MPALPEASDEITDTQAPGGPGWGRLPRAAQHCMGRGLVGCILCGWAMVPIHGPRQIHAHSGAHWSERGAHSRSRARVLTCSHSKPTQGGARQHGKVDRPPKATPHQPVPPTSSGCTLGRWWGQTLVGGNMHVGWRGWWWQRRGGGRRPTVPRGLGFGTGAAVDRGCTGVRVCWEEGVRLLCASLEPVAASYQVQHNACDWLQRVRQTEGAGGQEIERRERDERGDGGVVKLQGAHSTSQTHTKQST